MEFKHPKYYKELRKRNRSFLLRKEECTLGKLGNNDQAISDSHVIKDSSDRLERAPDPGLKSQAPSAKQEVTSYKLPGPRPISNSNKGLIHKRQAKPEPSSGS